MASPQLPANNHCHLIGSCLSLPPSLTFLLLSLSHPSLHHSPLPPSLTPFLHHSLTSPSISHPLPPPLHCVPHISEIENTSCFVWLATGRPSLPPSSGRRASRCRTSTGALPPSASTHLCIQPPERYVNKHLLAQHIVYFTVWLL